MDKKLSYCLGQNDDQILLVDMHDNPIGTIEKLAAHQQGLLHRAFSLFLYHDNSLLLQQRAVSKYHCGGLWANSCCSHPRPDESVAAAACRRLGEETGLFCQQPEELFSFVYRAQLDNQLTEHEYDHVLLAHHPMTDVSAYNFNPQEIQAMRWVETELLEKELRMQPQLFAPWFRLAAPRVIAHLRLLKLRSQ